MHHPLRQADLVLRGAKAGHVPGRGWSGIATPIVLTLICGSTYGAALGSFGGIWGDRLGQIVISGLKVPLLLLATFAISVPSFFVLNTLLGVRSDFAAVVRILIASQTGLTIVLAA